MLRLCHAPPHLARNLVGPDHARQGVVALLQPPVVCQLWQGARLGVLQLLVH